MLPIQPTPGTSWPWAKTQRHCWSIRIIRSPGRRIQLGLKDEGCAHPGFGANPQESFKDRGMAMVAAQAARLETCLAVRLRAMATSAGAPCAGRLVGGGGDAEDAADPQQRGPLPRGSDQVILELAGPTFANRCVAARKYVPNGCVATFR
jgi:threonine synthase